MRKFDLWTALIGAGLTSFGLVLPCDAASVTDTSVYYQPPAAGSTRQPRTGQTGSLVTFPGSTFVVDPNVTSGPVSVPVNPAQQIPSVPQPGAPTYALAFINITGGADGGITVFPNSGLFSVPVPVANPPQNIVVENVYFPVGGGAPCPPGVVCGSGVGLDEYSETLGVLLDDTFVNVFTPQTSTTVNSSATNGANVDGAVDTTNTGVRINALNPPVTFQNNPNGGNFDRWATTPAGTIGTNPQDLDVNEKTSDYALALYRGACPSGTFLNSTPAITQCSACPGEEVFNPATKKCQLPRLPKCPPDTFPEDGKCHCETITAGGKCV